MEQARRLEPIPVETSTVAAPEIMGGKIGPGSHRRGPQILRFRKSERLVHWAIAIPFLVCMTTAVGMILVQSRFPHSALRMILSWTHRISGICLIVFPLAAVYRSRGDFRIYFYNVRQAWIWTLSDVKWLLVAGAAAISSKVALPEQGKFNAAEKLNFMVLMGTYPFYILTGLTIWLTHNAFLSWVIHVSMALIGAPLVLGHIYMATINPSSRVGLQGMITGFVDRHWAKHHYRRWYLENFEATAVVRDLGPGDASMAADHVQVLCSCCSGVFHISAAVLVRAIPSSDPLHCPLCGADLCRLDLAPVPSVVEAALSEMATRGQAADLLVRAFLQGESNDSQPAESRCYIGFPQGDADSNLREVLGDKGTTEIPGAGA